MSWTTCTSGPNHVRRGVALFGGRALGDDVEVAVVLAGDGPAGQLRTRALALADPRELVEVRLDDAVTHGLLDGPSGRGRRQRADDVLDEPVDLCQRRQFVPLGLQFALALLALGDVLMDTHRP